MGTGLGPSINLPPQILPNVPPLPRPILDAPSADIPSYKPMLVPSGALRGPTGKEEDEEDNEPAPAEVQRVNVPFTDKDGTKYPANWLRLSTQQQRDKVPGGAISWEPD